MLQILTTIIISAAVTLASSWGVYNYLPLQILEKSQETRLGATITTINASDTLRGSRSVINTNFTNLNTDKMEVSTSSVDSITTLSNLVSIGTITTGTWTGSVIDVARQGTGTTSPSIYQVILGNGTDGLTVASSTGASGQLLTSNGAGAYPSWTTVTADQSANYTWTGDHLWTGAASSTLFAVTDTLYVGGNATTTIQGETTATSTFSGGLSTTGQFEAVATSTLNGCVGCLSGYENTSGAMGNYDGGTPATKTTTMNCSTGKNVIGGGVNLPDNNDWVSDSYPSSNSAWTITANANNNGDTGSAGTMYIICAYP